ncbi:MAG: flagellar biosynthesis protein FlhB [Syntrophales bacterium]|nr:flagellar biosynthesis protein FlhB [Syntrophales bacterium]
MPERDQGQERTEKATPKRREEAHKKGQVSRSRELSSVAILGAALVYFYFQAQEVTRKLMKLTVRLLTDSTRTEINVQNVTSLFMDLSYQFIVLVFPILAVVVLVALIVNLIQVGFLFSPVLLIPDLSKINPLRGIRQLFGFRSLIELAKGSLKIVVIALVAYLTIRSEMGNFLPLMNKGVWQITRFIGENAYRILGNVCFLLVVLAILDYSYQRWEFEKNLMMTKQEVREEYKQTEGDPHVKSRIKRMQLEITRRRMMAAVPKADVVITNPTHVAVALKYDPEMTLAPVVVAKGAGYLAERIKEIAKEYDVPIVEDRVVAQVLYRLVDVGEVIPENLYKAVAEILAYVYRLKNRTL